jgi:glycosyltransferase involved in cell wall biosynthesis
VGRLAAEKGLAYLLHSMVTVKRSLPCRLLIIGDGPERASLERMTDDLGLRDVVVFGGHQSNPFVTMARADLLVMSSVWESFGNVLIEGMALGVPVLSTRAAFGPDEIIDHGRTGWLVPPASAGALAGGILELLRDPDLRRRLGSAARTAAERFDASRRVADYESLFERLSGDPATRASS